MRNEYSANLAMAHRIAIVEQMHARIYAPRFKLPAQPVSIFARILSAIW